MMTEEIAELIDQLCVSTNETRRPADPNNLIRGFRVIADTISSGSAFDRSTVVSSETGFTVPLGRSADLRSIIRTASHEASVAMPELIDTKLLVTGRTWPNRVAAADIQSLQWPKDDRESGGTPVLNVNSLAVDLPGQGWFVVGVTGREVLYNPIGPEPILISRATGSADGLDIWVAQVASKYQGETEV